MELREAIQYYCRYQERSHSEVKNKLFEIGCPYSDVDLIIAELIEANLLNEERYARAIVRGKFRIKRWGRRKILQLLKLNKVSDYCIRKAMTEIDADEYFTVLEKLANKKWHEYRETKNVQLRKNKLYRYLLQKGYEQDLIQDVITAIINK